MMALTVAIALVLMKTVACIVEFPLRVDGKTLSQQLEFVTLLYEGAIDAEQAEIPRAADEIDLLGADGVSYGLFADRSIEMVPASAIAHSVSVVLRASDEFHCIGGRRH